MSFLSRIFQSGEQRASPTEGEYRPGPYLTSAGIIPASWGKNWNWWQLGYDPIGYGRSAMIQACVSAYAQTIAMCPGAHWETLANGGRRKVKNSALTRILRKPNSYQTPSDFLLNAVSFLYEHGNAYALALRNDRTEITELHLMDSRTSGERIAQTGDVFYHLGGNDIIDRRFAAIESGDLLHAVPARDVLHIRLETPRHPLKGETPLTSATLDLAASNAMARQAISFFENQSRPSGTLNTDMPLERKQVEELRARWNEQTQGLNAGGTPILTNGLKFTPMATAAKDSMLADIMKMTDQNIALAFRVPLQILGVGGTPFASTEALMQSWIAMGLGFALNHVELAFDQLFGIDRVDGQYTELDTSILLRSNFNERMEGLQKGVIGGIMSPNEARALEGLPAVEAGEEPRVQQQVVPLSQAAKELELKEQTQAQAQAQPARPPESAEDDNDDGDERDWSDLIRQAAQRHRERAYHS
jgi:HK97 family phage portal protein